MTTFYRYLAIKNRLSNHFKFYSISLYLRLSNVFLILFGYYYIILSVCILLVKEDSRWFTFIGAFIILNLGAVGLKLLSKQLQRVVANHKYITLPVHRYGRSPSTCLEHYVYNELTLEDIEEMKRY